MTDLLRAAAIVHLSLLICLYCHARLSSLAFGIVRVRRAIRHHSFSS